jgi:hypothetical protein
MVLLRPALLIALIFALLAPCFAAQNNGSGDLFTIAVAKPTLAKDVQVRYFFSGEFGGYGSSISDSVDGNRIVIKTGVEGKPAKTFKAIVFAPGCQFVNISVDDLTASSRQGEFQCQKLPTVELHGRVDRLQLGQKDLQVEALYKCDWAMPYFGIEDGSVSPLWLGKASLASDGSFTLEVPDFTADPTWPRISKQAELMFFLRDIQADKRVGLLVVSSSRSGNLQVAASYSEVAFEVPEM